MSDESPREEASNDPPAAGGWFDRHPAVVTVLAATAFLQVAQGLLMALRYGSLGPEASGGMAVFGIIVAPVTVLLLLPVILLLRRRHPAWRRGDRHRASWATSFGLTAALAGWMIADQAAANTGVPAIVEPWLEGLFALAVGVAAASWVHPPTKWLKVAAALVPVILVTAFLISPDPPAKAEDSADPTAEELSARPAPAGGPDVVLVSIDTLRADRLGVYGRSPSITPEMDRVAGEGVVFSRALAAAPWTVPSMASVLTGLPTIRHRAGRPLGSGMSLLRTPLDPALTTLAERFAAAGYRTRAIAGNGMVSADMGLAQGFDVFENSFSEAMGSGFVRDLPLTRLVMSLIPDEKLGDYRAEAVTDTALAWLAEEDDAPLFLWVHYLGPHVPLRADPADLNVKGLQAMAHETRPAAGEDGSVLGEVFTATSHVRGGTLWLSLADRTKLEERYDVTVSYVDEHVGRLFSALRERGGEKPAVVALFSDHGEEFWDHGHYEHGHDYYREVTQIPLVFWSPGRLPAGLTVEGLVGHVDVGPTLLELAALRVPVAESPDEGRSLVPLFHSGEAAAAESDEAGNEENPPPMWPPRFSGGNLYDLPATLVEDGRWRFILRANGQEELYDVELDPAERSNVASQNPDVTERYRQLLEPRLAALLEDSEGEEAQISPETLEALRSLGYVN